jgi:hypothetical protein
MRILASLARLGMGLWAGAVAGIAFVVAPRVFGFLADRPRAGELMAPIFRRIDLFGVGVAVLFAIAARRSPRRFFSAVGLGLAAAANVVVLSPLIRSGSARGPLYHSLSEGLWGVILVGSVLLALAGPSPRAPS